MPRSPHGALMASDCQTLWKTAAKGSWSSSGVLSSRTSAVSLTSGRTLTNISTAMNSEQIGSAMFQPNVWMSSVDRMTPTLPSVSASTCRNTPAQSVHTRSSHTRDGSQVPSVLWCCWLGSRKGIRPVKNWVVGCWHGYCVCVGMGHSSVCMAESSLLWLFVQQIECLQQIHNTLCGKLNETNNCSHSISLICRGFAVQLARC